jgi:hypothetical protein
MAVADIYDLDNQKILVTITDEENDPAAKDITGATLAAYARAGTDAPIVGTASISNAAGGEVLISFAAGAFADKPGLYDVQLRVTIGSDVQTVSAFQFTVFEAISP